jgi:hypothetical protein
MRVHHLASRARDSDQSERPGGIVAVMLAGMALPMVMLACWPELPCRSMSSEVTDPLALGLDEDVPVPSMSTSVPSSVNLTMGGPPGASKKVSGRESVPGAPVVAIFSAAVLALGVVGAVIQT